MIFILRLRQDKENDFFINDNFLPLKTVHSIIPIAILPPFIRPTKNLKNL